jgi:hypothetical protein
VATSFVEDFHNTNNPLKWQIGNLDNGVTASIPNNQYTIQTTQGYTSFPYPQAVGTLPQDFTLTATMAETSGGSSLTYGVAFRFSEQSGNVSNCYAFIISSSSTYELLEIGHGYTISSAPLWQGSYTAAGGTGSHTLQVKAQGSNYTFSIDGHTVKTGASSTTLNNTDISDGSMALVVTGPGGTFVATHVQLSIP